MINNKGIVRGGERINSIDLMKAISIILVVMGHCGSPITKWLYLFHMAVFFMISGYLWNERHALDKKHVWEYIKGKLKRLYIPYVLCNSIYWILNNSFIRLGIYTDDVRFYELFGGEMIQSLAVYQSFGDTLINILRSFLFVGGSQLGGATWFLSVLFIINVGHCILTYILNLAKLSLRWTRIIWISIFTICCVCAELVDNGMLNMPLDSLNKLFAIYVVYLLGILLRRIEREDFYKLKYGVGATILLFIFSFKGEISLNVGHITSIPFYIICSLLGWITIRSISSVFVGYSKKIMIRIGYNTLPIVLMHFLSFKLVSYVYLQIKGLDLIYLASFPVLYNAPRYLWILYTVVGVSIPLAVNYIYIKVKKIVLKN